MGRPELPRRPDHREARDDVPLHELLSRLPDPDPMPSGLSARIHASLEQERHRVVPRTRPHTASQGPSARLVLALSVAVALCSAAGLWVIHALVPGGADLSLHAVEGRDGGRGPALHQFLASGTPASSPSPAQPLVISASEGRYRRATLGVDAGTLLSARGSSGLAPMAGESPVLGPLAGERGVRDCLAAAHVVDAPVAVDLALFEGKPAAVIVTARGGTREARVFPRYCAPGRADVLAGPVTLR